jgi:hypothetical protein
MLSASPENIRLGGSDIKCQTAHYGIELITTVKSVIVHATHSGIVFGKLERFIKIGSGQTVSDEEGFLLEILQFINLT